MRVVAGTFGGRVLRAPKGSQTRPTSDRVREALFSILAAVDGARVLDLFAGSGALGIEALSRGASEATFVDSSAAAVAAVRQNLAELGLHAEVLRLPALRALACTPVADREYDLVFLDPPYRMASTLGPQLSAALPLILAPGARVVVESDRRAPLELDLTLSRERQYGDTLLRVHVAG
ncbi:MAG TPA: 16S rRNA (guanine(966)-N(2))-methyltransferase RsmD [Solirubrobacteraceae bacterium]|nr:16S rRNA (guanine(966)-N(2))-methyltransferase RsmD [Solirubrobacteraceae bacterium]